MRLLVCAGGSGGHIYPALAVVRAAQRKGVLEEAGWVGRPTGLEKEIVLKEREIRYFPVPAQGLARRQPWRWPGALALALASVPRALGIVNDFYPDVVVGFGGYLTLGPLVAAKLAGLPVALHEQNGKLGLANTLLARLADRVFLSFSETVGVPRGAKVTVTGNPVREEVLNAQGPLGQELLVVGGSHGSKALIEALVRNAPVLATIPGLKARVVVGRAAAAQEVEQRLRRAGLACQVMDYAQDMGAVLKAARLVLARAGATTVAELACAGRPAVLVPWRQAAGGHQQANARAFAGTGAGVLLSEDDLGKDAFPKVLRSLWGDEERLKAMAGAARRWARSDAADRVVEALFDLVKEKR